MSTIYSVSNVDMDENKVTLHESEKAAYHHIVRVLEKSARDGDDVAAAMPEIRENFRAGQFSSILEVLKEIYDGTGMSFTVTEHDYPL
jgi:hypothetical protein